MFVTYGLIAAAIIALLYPLFRAATSPLKDVPGPFLARFTRLWFFRSRWNGHAHLDNIALHGKYAKDGQFFAPIVRLGPNMYSISRPDKAVYGIGSKMPKSSWYEGWKHPSPERWTMFPDRNIQRHAETRRKFQSMYSMSSLLHYEEYVESTQDVFQTRLEEMVQDGRTVDMHHWLQCYAFDVIGNITYSRRFGFLDRGEDVENVLASLHSIMSYSTLAGIYSWAHPLLYKLLEKLPGSGAQGRNYIIQYTQRRIREREAERLLQSEKRHDHDHDHQHAPRDFLDITLDASQDPENAMTPYHVSMSNIIAGSDTTAISLSSIFYHLYTNPKSLKKLRQELDTTAGSRTEVGMNSWVAHYDAEIFGADVEEFRPERWIDADGEELKRMEGLFVPFGLGSRTCIGRHVFVFGDL
ncbi:uncharacterized protein MYCFIDRAFT_184329 [Pseudocercospora fijiensis CIRAD86]|uniref:Cytochrome P450 monooxygenase n=1 Tax=Pseudocercospora fijiensis (strain CIRAD86) TaxID=383855 RepID=N1Q5M6_PSEFD|nr:uncharacterized protein MYCFIDRAFT_184329 [Pseudocercospora fijiensis CIRAD86]EME87194.1 hypothetical protein MYCFIDRAFT_184329 [Pseudocercospora fijiensis CIRAD86]